jgi:hypothetical protein
LTLGKVILYLFERYFLGPTSYKEIWDMVLAAKYILTDLESVNEITGGQKIETHKFETEDRNHFLHKIKIITKFDASLKLILHEIKRFKRPWEFYGAG